MTKTGMASVGYFAGIMLTKQLVLTLSANFKTGQFMINADQFAVIESLSATAILREAMLRLSHHKTLSGSVAKFCKACDNSKEGGLAKSPGPSGTTR